MKFSLFQKSTQLHCCTSRPPPPANKPSKFAFQVDELGVKEAKKWSLVSPNRRFLLAGDLDGTRLIFYFVVELFLFFCVANDLVSIVSTIFSQI